jgi:hypothetical protein
VILDAWEKRVRGAVEELHRSDMITERPMPYESSDRCLVTDDEMGLLHVKIGEEVSDAVSTIQRATDDVVQTQSALPIIHDPPQGRREVRRGVAQMDDGFHERL